MEDQDIIQSDILNLVVEENFGTELNLKGKIVSNSSVLQ